jgi:molybdopterin-guanine dinucleotide biosynthesis protein A
LEVGGYCLAGGKSSRMGRDKALLELDGETLVARAMRKLGAVCADAAIAGGDERLARYGRVVVDRRPGSGPLGGIVAGLEDTRFEWNVFLAVDVPFVPVAVVRELLEAVEDRLIGVMVESAGDLQPLCAVYARRALDSLREDLEAGRGKVTAAVARAGEVKRLQVKQAEWFVNVNTPAEYAETLGRSR